MSTYGEMSESAEMRQVREAYAALDAELLAAVKAEGTTFADETRDRVSGAMLRCRKAIFGDLRTPPLLGDSCANAPPKIPTEEEIQRAFLERKVISLTRKP